MHSRQGKRILINLVVILEESSKIEALKVKDPLQDDIEESLTCMLFLPTFKKEN
ncbi:hypothetical protein [Ekhidna sp.]|uniref:hypothetical protein n=1 Tax=Ekhidna sp. TaxID=2608089 RepID=UPI003CCB8623